MSTQGPGHKLTEDFHTLSHRIFSFANSGVPRTDFLREVSKMLLDFSGCDAVELWLKEGDHSSRCEVRRDTKGSSHFEIMPSKQNGNGELSVTGKADSDMERLCKDMILGHYDPSSPFFTKNGSFRTGNTGNLLEFRSQTGGKVRPQILKIGGDYRSLALIPFAVDDENFGLVQLKSRHGDCFSEEEIKSYEDVAQILGLALVNQRGQAALRERVKELTCLYGIAQVVERPDISLEEILQGIVELLPPAWQYPEITCGRIILGGRFYSTSGFQESGQKQTAEIIVGEERRGLIEVIYTEERPEIDEGPFLKEERSLINAIARQVAIIIERKQAEEDRARLQKQLRHADRLATIGQLAAGVAHELNEPLGNILGFAQLVKKDPELSEQAHTDVERIEKASLHAREIIKKLMTFARQTPPRKGKVDLNRLVKEGLSFVESRCAKEGIELERFLSPGLPEVTADQAQLHQVLINLVVNAIQAMPQGGKLILRTCASDDHVSLIVQDTGTGMSEEVRKQIFIPFFTTKEVGQGTGLGLAVVHGIVTSHGGSINVESQVGHGTQFEVQLPVSGLHDVEESN